MVSLRFSWYFVQKSQHRLTRKLKISSSLKQPPHLQNWKLCLLLIKVSFLWKHLFWSVVFIYIYFILSMPGIDAKSMTTQLIGRSTCTCRLKLWLNVDTNKTVIVAGDLHGNLWLRWGLISVSKRKECFWDTTVNIQVFQLILSQSDYANPGLGGAALYQCLLVRGCV